MLSSKMQIHKMSSRINSIRDKNVIITFLEYYNMRKVGGRLNHGKRA